MKREPLTSTDAAARRFGQRGQQRVDARRSGAPRRRRPRPHARTARRPSTAARCRARARRRRPRHGRPGPGRRPRPCRRAPASAGRAARPARRWRRAPNRGWRCSCRRSASARARQRAARAACERPFTGSKASRPRTIASSGTPAASAQAVAASAFFTLCTPATRSVNVGVAGRACAAAAPSGSPCQRGVGACTSAGALQREGQHAARAGQLPPQRRVGRRRPGRPRCRAAPQRLDRPRRSRAPPPPPWP